MSKLTPPWEFKEALCAQVGTEVFYLEDRDEVRERARQADYSMAKRVCQSCVHLIECGEWGINKERFGLWGGFTPQERKLIRRRRNILIEEE